MDILHILNGDSTLQSFLKTGIEGDTFVWREVLSEGPLEENIRSASFWQQHLAWICDTFNESQQGYREKVLDPLAKLSDNFSEINLWFEFDLHCQVNLLGVLNYFNQKVDFSMPAIYLICPAEFPGLTNFAGMGELQADQLAFLYDNIRVQLSEVDFVIAAEVWQLYVKGDITKLKDYLNNTSFWANLQLLKPAMEAHVARVLKNENGLTLIEQKLLNLYRTGTVSRVDLYKHFWKTEKIYGMGDREIDLYLESLKNKGLIK